MTFFEKLQSLRNRYTIGNRLPWCFLINRLDYAEMVATVGEAGMFAGIPFHVSHLAQRGIPLIVLAWYEQT